MRAAAALSMMMAAALAAPLLHAQEPPAAVVDNFENGLDHWPCTDAGKSPLLQATDRALSGSSSAYSGPPGTMRVGRRRFPAPTAGRIEICFFDDMAASKHQMAGLLSHTGELLGIVCQGAPVYRYRMARTYTDTSVRRSRGWHTFAWDCDGRRVTATIDGQTIAVHERFGLARELCIGSFWDGSTGWYDDFRLLPCRPSEADALVEAEAFLVEEPGAAGPVEPVTKPGASGQAIRNWDARGHALEWLLQAPEPGPATLLIKFSTASPDARRELSFGPHRSVETFAGTGGWHTWRYHAVRVSTDARPAVLRMVNAGGSLNLDWLAVVTGTDDPGAYAEALDEALVNGPWFERAWAMTRARAGEADTEVTVPAFPALDPARLPRADMLTRWLRTREQGLPQARAAVLAALAPALRTRFQVPHWPLDADDTPRAARCYDRLLRYVRLTAPRFHDWPHAEGCRYHKREGSREWDVRQNATVALGYATLLRGPYDAVVTGIPRSHIEADTVALLRTIALTHTSNVLPTGDGMPWGDQWQSAFWAAIAGQAAWLVWPSLPDDVRLCVARMVEHEANRFNARPPDSGVKHDTKAEENAWNSEIIALAACMFPEHPNAALWHERTRVYMINALPRAQDRTLERLVDGRPASARITAVTVHPDYTLENHHRVHPDYLASGSLMLRNALYYRAADRPLPESMFFNVAETYAVIKRLTAVNGSCFYVNGQDWWPHRHDVPLLISGCVGVLMDDPEGVFLEEAALDFFATMHDRFDDGRAWHPREYNYDNAEEEMIARYAELYLLHRMFGDGPDPVSRDQFRRRQSGTHVYEIGGFVTHRTPARFVSFAWVNGAMGLVFANDDTWFTAPYERGMVGSITCAEFRDTTPRVTEHHVTALGDDGFSLFCRIERCEGALEQQIAVVSRADVPVVYLERIAVRQPVTLTGLRTGVFAVLNEDAPGIAPNVRILYGPDGFETRVAGLAEAADGTIDLPAGMPWINVDGRMGIVSSTRQWAYIDRNRYVRSRLREELYAHAPGDLPRRLDAGRTASQTAVLYCPNQGARETAAEPLEMVSVGEGVVAVRLRHNTGIIAHFGTDPQEVSAFGETRRLRPGQIVLLP